ncbi:hypothetical protein N7481_005269 [Penicillium waksmanii]|uniref:uncharacterized protein n=1 Tax=Penicillium waksmanii TaxID=69791 RepID=UPI00254740E1|nr:uncharacterized protein N7481_005269 [Penicillium waksmanii]KAJ5983170.1 hypothetical protein N7481_005269 [Penicillium waksmanii]
MFANTANSTPAVPSRNALRVLRQLALAGSTVGGFCTVGVITYDVHRRVRIAEQIIENKRTLRTSAPNYDATASAKRLAMMMDAAEAGEFMGLDSMKNKPSLRRTTGDDQTQGLRDSLEDSSQQQPRAVRSSDLDQYGPFSQSQSTKLKQSVEARVALARHFEPVEEACEEVDISVEERITQLISEDREIEAANVFLQNFYDAADAISFQTREVARKLFTVNCMKGNTFLARTLFERMEKVSVIDTQMWATMMHLLAKGGHIDSVGSIYERHHKKLRVPAYLLEVVLRSLLESRRVNPAKNLFYARIKNDKNGGLCGAFLDGLWRKTRSLDLIIAEFRNILAALANLDRSPNEKLFNPLVKAFIESGQHEDAEDLVADMPKKYNVQPGSRTLGLLIYAKALTCDWEGVFAGMHEMHRLEFTRNKRDFAYAFDRVFLEYYPTHSGREIFDFLTSCIHQFELVPDKILHRHILEALVEKGDSSLIGQISRLAEERQWNTGLDQDQFLSILIARRVSMQDSPVGFWRMIQAAKKQYGQAATTRRLLGTGSASYSLDRGVLYPIHKPANETFSRSLDDLEALSVFRTAGASGFVLRPTHIHLAVIATILGHGWLGLADAQIIIKSEYPNWLKGRSVGTNPAFPLVPPIFFQQILQLDKGVSDTALLKMAIFEYYNLCRDTPHLTVKHHALASLSKKLISSKQGPKAIDILTAVYKSTWRKSHGFDQVLFKMLFRAFASTENLRGVWWCMVAVLSRTEPAIQDFYVEVRRLMPSLEQICTRQGRNDDSKAIHNISVLHRLAESLLCSMQGEANWVSKSPHPESKIRGRMEVNSRSAEEQKILPRGSTEEMVYHFDEEMELDLLMNNNIPTEDEVIRMWKESRLVNQEFWLPEDPKYPREESSGDKEFADVAIAHPCIYNTTVYNMYIVSS